MSEREPIYLVVGDEAMAERADFLALRDTHRQLLDVLKAGGDGTDLLAACAQAAGFDARLVEFYAAVPGRREDFAGA